MLNTLDGFNLQPRLSVPFDGPIDVKDSVNSRDVFLVSLGDTLPGGDKGGEVVGINQVVWDPATTTLHVESDQFLDQHTRYALIVTDGVLDANGQHVQASEAFTRFRHDLNFGQTKDPVLKAYRKDLLDAMAAARQVGVPESDIAVASVFTTQSATAVLEKIRDQIHAGLPLAPAKADFDLGPNGAPTVFNLNQVTSITHNQQRTVSGPLTPVTLPLTSLKDVIPGAVSQVAFGRYVSPDYEVHPGEYIPAEGVGTRTGTPAVQRYNVIYFTLYLPSGPEPKDGWPVAIWGHGGSGSKDATSSGVPVIAAMMAENGIATIGINAVGHGFGPGSTLTVTQSGGGTVTLPAGGRGIDQNGDGTIGSSEGFLAASPQAIISERDGRIQTDADLMQLVQVIQAGVVVDGNGRDLDPSRVYLTPWTEPWRSRKSSTTTSGSAQPGDPVAYAPHLRKDPLPGVPAKSVIVQFAKGDQLDSNPTATALLRAGDLADRATFYRYDLAFPQYQQDPNNPLTTAPLYYPHSFAALITSTNPTIKKVALAAQNQVATFFASDGTQTIQPQPPDGFGFGLIPEKFFEGVDLPIEGGLPEGLNFIVPATAQAQASGSQASGPILMDAASNQLNGERLEWPLTATSVPPGNPLLPTSGSTSAAQTVPQAAPAVPVPPIAGPSAMLTSPLIDLALDALPPLARPESALDDLAAGLLRPARRRH